MAEILRGRLGPIRLASVVQLAEAEVVTGRVTLDAGEVAFHRGRLTTATAGPLKGVQALYELFVSEQGEFRLIAENVPEGPALGSMLGLVIEGCRLADEWARLAPIVLKPVQTLIASTPAEQALVARLDGTRTLQQALQGPRAPIIDFVLQACEMGALAEVPRDGIPARAPTPAPAPAREARPPADYDSAMDLGRRHTREGAWEPAIAAFRVALGAQPNDRVALQNLKRAEQARDGHVEKSVFQWFRRT